MGLRYTPRPVAIMSRTFFLRERDAAVGSGGGGDGGVAVVLEVDALYGNMLVSSSGSMTPAAAAVRDARVDEVLADLQQLVCARLRYPAGTRVGAGLRWHHRQLCGAHSQLMLCAGW